MLKPTHSTGVMLALLVASGCHDDAPVVDDGTATGDTATATTTPQSPSSSSTHDTVDPDSSTGSMEPLPPPMPAQFVVTIENLSSTGLMWSPLSPGVWATHRVDADVLFEVGTPDDGEGLEALAEDGAPSALAAAVATHPGVTQAGVFDTPVMSGRPGPLLPGDAYQLALTAEPGTRLSLATMLMGTNDVFVATVSPGISLFGADGLPLGERDVSSSLRLWDAGTEVDQAPGQGPWQALHGGSPNVGPVEFSIVVAHGSSTRAIPLGPDLVAVEVDIDPADPDGLVVTLTNVSQTRGTLVTPFSSLVWALHDQTTGLFTEGEAASPELEALAEDGDAGPLDAWLADMPQVEQHAVIPGPWLPAQSVVLAFTPSPDFPRLGLATMVMESNDAFLAMGPGGVSLFANGVRRDPDDIEADIVASLTPWDAGTEANEVPGVGANQAPRQAAPGTGPVDLDVLVVQRYADATDDLAGPLVGGLLAVEVALTAGDYTIRITNVSDSTAFPAMLSPTAWAVHDQTVRLFEVDMPAGFALEALAEDGQAYPLSINLGATAGVLANGVQDEHAEPGIPTVGPLLPGDAYEIVVTPDPVHRFLSIAAMIMPSNDTFAALGPQGVALLDELGDPRPPAEVEAELQAELQAWDAGTEGDQAGAAGRDMAPNGVFDTGPGKGSSLVREADDRAIWSLPRAERVVRVTVAPAG